MYTIDVSQMLTCSMFGRMKQTCGWERKKARTLDVNLFVFMIHGSANFYLEQMKYTVSAGEILLIPAHTSYWARTADACEYFFFHFSGEVSQVDDTPQFPGFENRFSFHLSKRSKDRIYFDLKCTDRYAFEKIYQSILQCIEYRSCSTYAARLLFDAEWMKILLILGEVLEKKKHNTPILVEKMVLYIHKNLTGPLHLSDISAHCSVSAPYASKLFKKYMGITVTEYINSEKLYYAYNLMKNTSMHISEIADYLGYCDVFYFSKIFKKKFGKAPTRI